MVFSIDRKVQSLFHLGLCGKSLKKIGGLQIGFTFVYIFCLKQKTNVLNFKELTPVVFSDLAVNTMANLEHGLASRQVLPTVLCIMDI